LIRSKQSDYDLRGAFCQEGNVNGDVVAARYCGSGGWNARLPAALAARHVSQPLLPAFRPALWQPISSAATSSAWRFAFFTTYPHFRLSGGCRDHWLLWRIDPRSRLFAEGGNAAAIGPHCMGVGAVAAHLFGSLLMTFAGIATVVWLKA